MIPAKTLLRRLAREQHGAQLVEYLLITPVVIVLLAAILGQATLAATGLIACESAARDAAVAAARGNDPLLAARKAAPEWNVTLAGPVDVSSGDYHGVQVTVSLTVPALPLRWMAGHNLPISRTVTMPNERG